MDEAEAAQKVALLAEHDAEMDRLFLDVVNAERDYGTNSNTYYEAKLRVIQHVWDRLSG